MWVYEKVMADFGTVDILVNNVCICRMIQIMDIEVAEWDKILAVNLVLPSSAVANLSCKPAARAKSSV